MGACSLDDVLGTGDLPPHLTDPGVTETPAGARAAYRGAVARMRHAFAGGHTSVVPTGGQITDELEADGLGGNPVDLRDIPDGTDAFGRASQLYGRLHQVRGQASEAIGLLTRFAPDSEPLTGHLYALQAYAEIFLADTFCSGVPLSTLDFDGDFTYRPGSTTAEIYESALALLETARPLVADSGRFENLTRVGTGRALLALGRFAEAAAAVAEVPDAFQYQVSYSPEPDMQSFARLITVGVSGPLENWNFTVGDREGGNGLDFVSSADPRTRVVSFGLNQRGATIHHPAKYRGDGSGPIVMASGTEARLIEAEAALQAGDVGGWIGILNHLRRTAWTMIEPSAGGPLPDLVDPGSPDARVDLLFRERAFWLFLTGHRQGDLRRLIRQYGRTSDQVYPFGLYPGTSALQEYGNDVDLPVPLTEITLNPHFSGCASRGA